MIVIDQRFFDALLFITAPAPESVLTYLTDILGTVADPNLDSWQLAYARANTNEFHVFAQGTAEVSNGPLGVFDPTLLLNDEYVIRLTAQDINGQTATQEITIAVTANAKLGNFRLEFTDLQIPLAGIPITITRVYDTLQAGDSGDFGFGWSLAAADARIRETLPVDPRETGPFGVGMIAARPFKAGTRLYFTNPDGQRVGFTFNPVPVTTLFGQYWRPRFTPDPGVYDTLTDGFPGLAGNSVLLAKAPDGTFHLFGLGTSYNPADYRLTTKDGLIYHYNQFTGLQSITDRNGNVLTFTKEGIFSSLGPSIQFVRDNLGRITQIIDPAGHAILYQYDAHGDLIAMTNQLASTTTYRYHETRPHYLVEMSDPCGCNPAVRAEYGDDGRLIAAGDALGNKATQSFDLNNMMETMTDELGNITMLRYDERGNITQRINPLGGVRSYVLDANDNVVSETDERGFTYTRTFDVSGNLLSETDPLSGVKSYTYNQFNKVVTFTDQLGRTIEHLYDSKGNETETIDAAGFHTYQTFDLSGRKTSFTDAASYTTSFVYGTYLDQPTQVIFADGASRSFTYNIYGEMTQVTDELGNITNTSYDDLGRPISILDANGGLTQFGFSDDNKLISLTDPVGNTTRWEYNVAGNRTKEIDPLGNIKQFTFDAARNVVEIIDRNGRLRQFDYDALGRMIEERWLDGATVVRTISYQYDANGNLIFTSDPDSTYAFQYDALNRATSVDNAGTPGMPNVVLYYTFDLVGNVLSVSDNLGVTVTYAYDPRNLVWSQTWFGTGIDPVRVDFAYDERGLRTEVKRYSDLAGTQLVARSTLGYDSRGRMTDLIHKDARDAVFANYDYYYDFAGRLTREIHHGETIDYSYDPTGQLIGADHSIFSDELYTYDLNGNRIGNGYVVGPGNQILSDGTYDYAYDSEGNMVRKTEIATGTVTEFTWDHRNRLVRVTERTASGIILKESNYTYDIFDRRIAKSVDWDGEGPQPPEKALFVYDGVNTWADFNEAGLIITRYFFGTKIDELLGRYRPGERIAWYLTDNLGTVRDLVNAAGNFFNHIDYNSFGAILHQTNPALVGRFLFSGREFDPETALYYYRNRYFSPSLERFINEDPIRFASNDFNLYRYANNHPLDLTDPFGFMAISESSSIRRAQPIEHNLGICEIWINFPSMRISLPLRPLYRRWTTLVACVNMAFFFGAGIGLTSIQLKAAQKYNIRATWNGLPVGYYVV